MKMPKNKEEYERRLLNAFQRGMVSGYGVDHTNIISEEKDKSIEFMKDYNFKYDYEELIKLGVAE